MASNSARQLTSQLEALVDRAYERHDAALGGMRAHRYSFANLIADAVAGWIDLTEAMLLPYKLLAEPTAPNVSITVKRGKPAASGAGCIANVSLGDSTLIASDLVHRGAASLIPGVAVNARVTTNGDAVMVDLSGLPADLNEGSYCGTLKHGDAVVATLTVTVITG